MAPMVRHSTSIRLRSPARFEAVRVQPHAGSLPRMAAKRPSPSGRERSPTADPALAVRLGAEAIGTFALTFVAAGGDVTANLTGGDVTPVARALAPGLLVMALIYAIGDRSGAHFNP